MTGSAPALGGRVGAAAATSGGAGLRWVHDPDDDHACMRQLTALHDLAGGRVVCHPTPGATWPVLIRDLLEALGKPRDALARERRLRDGARLVQVWMCAERVEHLVVLRAHRLRPLLLDRFAELAAATGTTIWLVWHHRDPPGRIGAVWSWPTAVDTLRRVRVRPPLSEHLRPRSVDAIHREAVTEARREARLWRVAPPRQRRYTQPGCEVGALLQRLSIEAATWAELDLRLDAARAGFAIEGLTLVLPDAQHLRDMIGPRLPAPVVTCLRRIVCPTSAVALLLAWATDARPGRIAGCMQRSVSPDGEHVGLLPGGYRIPGSVQVILRAALIEHGLRGLPPYTFLARPDDTSYCAQAMANLITRVAGRAEVALPHSFERNDFGPERPFAAELVNTGRVRLEGAPPRPRFQPDHDSLPRRRRWRP